MASWPDAFAVSNRASPVNALAAGAHAASKREQFEKQQAQRSEDRGAALDSSSEDNAILTVQAAYFYAWSWWRELLFWLACLASGLTLLLILRWNHDWHAALRYRRVDPDDPEADYVLAMSTDHYHTLCAIETLDPVSRKWMRRRPGPSECCSFEWRSTRFWFNPTSRTWTRVQFDVAQPYRELHRRAAAAAWHESVASPDERSVQRTDRINMYGINVLDVKPKPFWVLLLEEVLRPFFVFQVFSMAVWFTQDYVVYAYTVLALSVVAVLNTTYTTWINIHDLQRLAKSDVPVQRLECTTGAPEESAGLGWSPLPTLRPVPGMSSELVPGDLIQITSDLVLPCDVVLLTGSCVVNEAMLTGESAPVLKASLPAQMDTVFNPAGERDTKYLLFSGTRVVQARASPQAPFPVEPLRTQGRSAAATAEPSVLWQLSRDAAAKALGDHLRASGASDAEVIAAEKGFRATCRGPPLPVVGMVVQTGFSTAKGQLIRGILYPKPSKFDFQRQSYNFILVLLLACLAGSLATVAFSVQQGVDGLDVFKACLNLLTVTIPPALPLALSIGLSAAMFRVQGLGVFCTSPPRITAAGRSLTTRHSVNCLCFDKTGTLTEEGLTLEGVQSLEVAEDKLRTGAMERQLSYFYHMTMSSRGTKSVFAGASADALGPADLASSLRLGMVHVLAACHGLSALQNVPPSKAVPAALHMPKAVRISSDDTAEESPAGGDTQKSIVYTMEHLKAHFVGDPLEVQMFLSTGWSFLARTDGSESESEFDMAGFIALPPPDESLANDVWSLPSLPRHVDTILFPPASFVTANSQALAILRRFDFDSSLRRMSVVVQYVPVDLVRPTKSDKARADATQYAILTKGAPESIRDICEPSTVPADFQATLRSLTMEGFRVLACAVRPLSSASGGDQTGDAVLSHLMTGSRAALEQKLLFTGFLVMENKLKKETSPMLESYIRAGLRCVMVTGDNPLTAIAVAKRCGPFFVRPSRRLCHLDLETPNEPGQLQLPRLVLRDVMRPDVAIDLNDLLRGRIPGYHVAPNPYFDAGVPQSPTIGESQAAPYGLLRTWSETSADVDFAVTGAAFVALQSQHDDILRERELAQHKDRDTMARVRRAFGRLFATRSWPAYDTIGEQGKLLAPIVRTETGQDVPLTPLQVVLGRANIFARMSPQNKQQLMTSLQDMSYVVCMTGDGANDSGALKTADIGISIQASAPIPVVEEMKAVEAAAADDNSSLLYRALVRVGLRRANKSSAEADSVAAAPSIAAPFSTQIAHIGAVHIVLTEGRCCLVSTFAMFKFMFCYGLIQFTSVIVLYKLVLELADYQYLWADLGLVFPLVLTMPLITAQKTLCRGRPESDLLAPSVFRSVLGLSAIVVGFQGVAAEMLHMQDFYEPPIIGDGSDATDTMFNVDTTTSYLFSSFQYIAVGIALSQSFGLFRQPLYHHFLLCAVFITQLVVMSVFLLAPNDGIAEAFSLAPLDETFRWRLWGLALGNCVVFALFERFCVPHTSPDEEPFDVEGVLRELPPAPVLDRSGRIKAAAPPPAPRPDFQPTLLPKMRWRKPAYVVVDEVASPVWSALA